MGAELHVKGGRRDFDFSLCISLFLPHIVCASLATLAFPFVIGNAQMCHPPPARKASFPPMTQENMTVVLSYFFRLADFKYVQECGRILKISHFVATDRHEALVVLATSLGTLADNIKN